MTGSTQNTNREYQPIFIDLSVEPNNTETKEILRKCLNHIDYKPQAKNAWAVRRLLVSLYEAQIAIGDRLHFLVAMPETETHWDTTDSSFRSVVRTLKKKLRDAEVLKLKKKHYYLEQASFDSIKNKSTCALFSVSMPYLDEYKRKAKVNSVGKNLICYDKASGRKISKPKQESVELTKINKIIQKHQVMLSDRFEVQGVKRSFSNLDAKRGGRFYAPWTNLKSEDRKSQLTIDGQPVCEVDISNCHLRILAASLGHTLPDGDLYGSITGATRPVVKALFVEMVGAGNAHKANLTNDSKEALLKQGVNDWGDLSKVNEELRVKFPFLEKLRPDVLDGEALNYYESCIIGRSILSLEVLHQICSLPMHDALIVPKYAAAKAQKVMAEVFKLYCAEMGWDHEVPLVTGIK